MSQVIPRSVREEAAESLGGFTKILQQTLLASFFILDHLDDYLSRRLKISQLLSLLIMISRQVPDLLHIADHLFVSVSFDLGQLLQSICVTIYNIGQISHLIMLSQQQAFKLCQSKENMSTEENYLKETKEGKEYLYSPWQQPWPSLAAWRPYLSEQNCPAPKFQPGPPEV